MYGKASVKFPILGGRAFWRDCAEGERHCRSPLAQSDYSAINSVLRNREKIPGRVSRATARSATMGMVC